MAVREPLAPHDALRLQLEGRLEVVEALVARWQAAASLLADDSALVSDSWHDLPAADAEAAPAIEALRAKAGDADERLGALTRARMQVAFTLHARLAALGIACSSTDAIAALELLKQLQPLTFGVLNTPPVQPADTMRPANLPLAFATLVVTLIISLAMRQPLFIGVAFVMVGLTSIARTLYKVWLSWPKKLKSTLIVLTRHSLLVRDQTVRLNEVTNVVYRTLRGGGLEVRMHRGDRTSFRLIVHDPGQLLLRGLRERGVKISPRWPKESRNP